MLIGRDTLDSGYTRCRVRGGLFSCLEVMRGIFCYLPPPTLAITRCTLGLMWRGYSRETLECDIDELWTSPYCTTSLYHWQSFRLDVHLLFFAEFVSQEGNIALFIIVSCLRAWSKKVSGEGRRQHRIRTGSPLRDLR